MIDISSTNEMSDSDFKVIANLAYDEAGLVFLPEKASLVKSRINRRLRKLKIDSFAEYTAYVLSDAGEGERSIMISSLTTNVSNFFREPHHFCILRNETFPPLIKQAQAGGRVRIWSAGCSTGQEPYSIAMTLLDMEPSVRSLDIKILATDIDPNVISTAKQAYYDIREIKDIDERYQSAYLHKVRDGIREGFEIADKVRSLVSFRELNLLRPWPISGVMDVIFCRNVVIYFDEETQLSLWPKFESVTATDGWLFVGHSERLSDKLETNFTTAGPTAYRNLTPVSS
jgi:chemotaxis protein methyltransferase CheR